MDVSRSLAIEVCAWAVAIAFLVFWQRKQNMIGVGLVLAYLTNLWLIHWPAAVIYLLPWYTNWPLDVVEAGFREATFAVLGIVVGVLWLAPRISRWYLRRGEQTTATPEVSVAYGYMAVGLVSFVLVQYVVGQIASLTSVFAGGLNFLSAGLGLASREAWLRRRMPTFAMWLLVALSLPLLTTVSQGFAGFGVSAAIGVLAFVATFYRPTRHVLLAAVLLAFVGLSFYESYFRDRTAIRAVVWGGEGLSARIEQISQTLTSIEWFDPTNQQHLSRIDTRLDQNFLVGSAVQYLQSGLTDWAYGQTVSDAAIAIVPRAIWPDKPVAAGSNGLVTRFTGIAFAQGTSVGIGNVMEWYINFGGWGVFLGEVLLGAVVGTFDLIAGKRLQAGDLRGFARWFVPGLGLLQVGGSFVEIVGSVAAGAVAATVVTRVILPRAKQASPGPAIETLVKQPAGAG